MKVVRHDSGLWKSLSKGAFGGHVLVGIQEGAGSQGETTLAQIAQWLHDGTSRIPARPFLTTTLDGRLGAVKQMIRRLAKGVLDGKIRAPDALAFLGQWGRDRVIERIVSRAFEKNAESTERQKGSTVPLVDTGQLKSSITYVVQMGEQEE